MCNCINNFSLTDLISIIISIITLIATILIPIRIMNSQSYSGMYAQYMSFDFGHAYYSVIKFFYETCKCDVEKISEEYYKRYILDFERYKRKEINLEDILHYQRRILNDYFLEVEYCRESESRIRKRIKNDWTVCESYVLKILMYMNKASDENPNIFMDISSIKYAPIPKTKGLSKYLAKLHDDLKKEDRWL